MQFIKVGNRIIEVPEDDTWRYESYARKITYYAQRRERARQRWQATQAYLLDFD